MIVTAVDPGLAHLGLCTLEYTQNRTRLLDAGVVSTKKSSARGRKVADDDLDRMRVLWLNIHQQVIEFKPVALGVETYTVFKPGQGGQGKGAGWKALYGFGVAIAVGFEHGLTVYTFRPSEMKRKIANINSATKVDVERAVRSRVENLDDFLQQVPPGDHEHLTDAVGHGLLTLERHLRA